MTFLPVLCARLLGRLSRELSDVHRDGRFPRCFFYVLDKMDAQAADAFYVSTRTSLKHQNTLSKLIPAAERL